MTILIKCMLATFHNWDGPEKKLTFLYIFLKKLIADHNTIPPNVVVKGNVMVILVDLKYDFLDLLQRKEMSVS